METQSKLIYVADPNDSIRELAAIALKDYDIERFDEGREMMKRYKKRKRNVDLMILSDDLPDTDVTGFIRHIREKHWDDFPVIMTSRVPEMADVAEEYGYVFVEKDKDFIDNLRKAVYRLLEESDQPL